MTTVLEFQNVTRSFGHGPAVLDGVTFSMKSGEIVGLLGRNGAGKTTLINIAMGMLFPHSGAVRVFGMSPTDRPVDVKKRIGYVAEDQLFPAGMRMAEVISIHRQLFPQWDSALEHELMGRFGLEGNTRKIGKLSKGQARQLALICAVCHRPELLILDEPAGGLDPAARREFLETSIQLLNREGSAILFSSHHIDDVQRLDARVVLLDDGRVLIDRAMEDLRERHCVAIVPRRAIGDTALEAQPGCLRVRSVIDEYHATFAAEPDVVREQLARTLDLHDVQCARLPLEELFIELVGAERAAEMA